MNRTASSDDLGLGARVTNEAPGRLLNPDGTFNVARRGLPFWQSLHLYHAFTRMSWARFYVVVASAYIAINLLFAAAFFLAGRGAVTGVAAATPAGRFLECFFFSVQTFSTIGYGSFAPITTAAHLLVTAEALTGMFFVALATGMVFARFARPRAKILFSDRAVVAPFGDGKAFMFRLANARKSQLLEVQATAVLARRDETLGSGRRFFPLVLEREQIMFLPLHWVVVHPITPDSPFWDLDEQSSREAGVECLILIRGIDETNSETVHARASYEAGQLVWGARFEDMYDSPSDSVVGIDLGKLSNIRPAGLS
jgi:inward rectifier potassium channel